MVRLYGLFRIDDEVKRAKNFTHHHSLKRSSNTASLGFIKYLDREKEWK